MVRLRSALPKIRRSEFALSMWPVRRLRHKYAKRARLKSLTNSVVKMPISNKYSSLESSLSVLVVSQHYWPETFRINEVVESLRACGCDVEVIAGQPNYPKGKTFEGYNAFGIGTERHPSGYEIHRVPVIPRGKGGAISRIANYISFVFTSNLVGPWLARSKRYDVIFVYGISPILQGLTGVTFKYLKGAALVIWVQDLWPDTLEATGFVKNKYVLDAVGLLTRFIYRRADLLLAQSKGFMDKIRAVAGRQVPIAYHPNPGDLSLVEHSETSSSLDLPAGFNVVFAGNLGKAQALETILDAAARIDDSEITITFVGDGSRSDWLRKEVARLELKNIRLVGRFPSEAMPGILGKASALLVTLNRADNLSITIPSKIATYLAAGRPVIACLDGEGAHIISEAKAGLTVSAEDSEGLATAILNLKNMSNESRRAMGAAGRHYFDRNLAPGHLALTLVDHFRSILRRQADSNSSRLFL